KSDPPYWAGTPSRNFHTTPAGERLTPYVRFNMQQAEYTVDLQWNRVSNLKPSCPEADTLSLGHRGLLQ
ncbi:hypothetical protein AVEN_270968-1, partial [Araneus ventricosus]